jgi:hypothetical protein
MSSFMLWKISLNFTGSNGKINAVMRMNLYKYCEIRLAVVTCFSVLQIYVMFGSKCVRVRNSKFTALGIHCCATVS